MISGDHKQPSLNPRFYTKTELDSLADAFFQEFNPTGEIPFDIEVVIERDLGISILPFSELKRFFGIEAYITLSLKKIHVDPFLMDLDQNEKRYRFTLAEEVAHSILHKDLFTGIKTPEDYLDLYNEMSPQNYRRMDRDAKYLGAAILMPARPFEASAIELHQEIVNGQHSPQMLQYMLIEKLAVLYNTSQFTTAIRFQELGLASRLTA